MAIRLAMLAHHYRSDWEWTDADLMRRTGPARPCGGPRSAASSRGRPPSARHEVRAALAADLDAPPRSPPSTPGPPTEPGDGSGASWSVGLLDARLGILL